MQWTTKGYSNGAEYDGYVDDEGRRQDKGRFRDAQGGVYVGAWRDMKMEGLGWYRWAGGGQYTGEFAGGVFSGRGVYEDGGMRYVGGYEGGRKCGVGMLWGRNEAGKETVLLQEWEGGELKDSQRPEEHATLSFIQEGEALEDAVALRLPTVPAPTQDQWKIVAAKKSQTLPSGSTYTGGFLSKKRHGYGVWTHPEGDKYTGTWKGNKKAGWGVYLQSNGRRYVGQWHGDKMAGWGAYFFSADDCFVGRYKEDRKEGMGVHLKPDGALLQVWGEADGKIESERDATDEEVERYSKLRDALVQILDGVVAKGEAQEDVPTGDETAGAPSPSPSPPPDQDAAVDDGDAEEAPPAEPLHADPTDHTPPDDVAERGDEE